MFDKIKNIGSDLVDEKKRAFNKEANGYKIRICNEKNLAVFAILKEDKMIIFPTTIRVGDVVVDQRNNRFYVSKTTEKHDYKVTVDNVEQEISVVVLEFNQEPLKDLTLTGFLSINNSIESSVVNHGNVDKIIIQTNNNQMNTNIELPVVDYWKKLRCELKYTFDNEQYGQYIGEVEKAFKERRPINDKIQASVLKKVAESVRGFIIDFGAKFLAEVVTKNV